MNNYFIIHGSYGNPYKNWIPWLKREFSKIKLNCIIPNFPSPYKQDYESWSKILKAYLDIGYITEDTIFITHSLGGIFIAKFLIQNKLKIKNPYVPQFDAEKFSEYIGAEKILINNAGHFNKKYGYKEFKEILEFI